MYIIANKNLDKQKRNQKNEFNQISTYIKNYIDCNTHVVVFGIFNAKTGKDEEGIVNGDRIISRNGVFLRNIIKMQHLLLINCLPCCVGK